MLVLAQVTTPNEFSALEKRSRSFGCLALFQWLFCRSSLMLQRFNTEVMITVTVAEAISAKDSLTSHLITR
jgi:hypothetical protein